MVSVLKKNLPLKVSEIICFHPLFRGVICRIMIFPYFQNLTILGVFGVSEALFCFQFKMLLQLKNTRLAIMRFAFSTFLET